MSGVLKWMSKHPRMASALGGAVGLFLFAGILGALFGEGSPETVRTSSAERAAATASATATATPTQVALPADISVSSPSDGSNVQRSTVTIRGSVAHGRRVEVDDHRVKTRGGRFRRAVELAFGENTIYITAKGDDDKTQIQTVTVHRTRTAVEIAQARAARKAAAEAKLAAVRSSAQALPFKQLNKNPDRFEGTKVTYQGKIFQIFEEGGKTIMLLSVTDEGYDFWTDEVYVTYNGTIDSVEDDIVTIFGTVTGSESYDTKIGGSNTTPAIRATIIDE